VLDLSAPDYEGYDGVKSARTFSAVYITFTLEFDSSDKLSIDDVKWSLPVDISDAVGADQLVIVTDISVKSKSGKLIFTVTVAFESGADAAKFQALFACLEDEASDCAYDVSNYDFLLAVVAEDGYTVSSAELTVYTCEDDTEVADPNDCDNTANSAAKIGGAVSFAAAGLAVVYQL